MLIEHSLYQHRQYYTIVLTPYCEIKALNKSSTLPPITAGSDLLCHDTQPPRIGKLNLMVRGEWWTHTGAELNPWLKQNLITLITTKRQPPAKLNHIRWPTSEREAHKKVQGKKGVTYANTRQATTFQHRAIILAMCCYCCLVCFFFFLLMLR